MRFFQAILWLLLSLWVLGLLACAGKNAQQESFVEYRKMMERQKALAATQGEEFTKKIPEMKASEYERLGDSYLRQGNADLAFVQYGKALRLDPTQSRVRYKMGRVLMERGFTEEAKKEFEALLKSNPNHARDLNQEAAKPTRIKR